MLTGLDTLKWHLEHLMKESDSADACAEIEDAIDEIQATFDAIDQQMAALSRRISDLESYHN